jgi:hypothetical protein
MEDWLLLTYDISIMVITYYRKITSLGMPAVVLSSLCKEGSGLVSEGDIDGAIQNVLAKRLAGKRVALRLKNIILS